MNRFLNPNQGSHVDPSLPLDVLYYRLRCGRSLIFQAVTVRLANVNPKKVQRSQLLPVKIEKLLYSHILVRVPVFVDFKTFFVSF